MPPQEINHMFRNLVHSGSKSVDLCEFISDIAQELMSKKREGEFADFKLVVVVRYFSGSHYFCGSRL